MRLIAGTTLLWLCVASFSPALALQFNSDNYLSKPHGVATLIITTGEQTTMFMTTLSLFPRWELTAAAYLYNRDEDRTTGEGYSGSVYAKYMIHENQAKTGGIAFKFGLGQKPSYVLDGTGFESASQTLWVNAPLTLPFLDNKLSWDIMTGASVTRNFGDNEATVGAFTYSTRLAWYPKDPRLGWSRRPMARRVRRGSPPNTRRGCVGSLPRGPTSRSLTAASSMARTPRASRSA